MVERTRTKGSYIMSENMVEILKFQRLSVIPDEL